MELQQGECLGKLDSVTVLSLLSDEEVMKGHVEAETRVFKLNATNTGHVDATNSGREDKIYQQLHIDTLHLETDN